MRNQIKFRPNRIPRFTLMATAIALGTLASFSLSAYELVDLGVGVSPKDINGNLTVVGSRSTAPATSTAFRWTAAGGIEDIVAGTVANTINDNEQIAGNTLTGAFLMDGASVLEWDGFGAYGINDTGSCLRRQDHGKQLPAQSAYPLHRRSMTETIGPYMISPLSIRAAPVRVSMLISTCCRISTTAAMQSEPGSNRTDGFLPDPDRYECTR